jgi:hypothetical protein
MKLTLVIDDPKLTQELDAQLSLTALIQQIADSQINDDCSILSIASAYEGRGRDS